MHATLVAGWQNAHNRWMFSLPASPPPPLTFYSPEVRVEEQIASIPVPSHTKVLKKDPQGTVSKPSVYLPETIEKKEDLSRKISRDFETELSRQRLFKDQSSKTIPRRVQHIARVEDIDLSDILVFRVFTSYYHRLSLRIKGQIRYPLEVVRERKEGMVYVSFVLSRDGKISDLKIVESSGDQRFDHAALKAIKESVPFPPFPMEIVESKMTLYLPVSFEID